MAEAPTARDSRDSDCGNRAEVTALYSDRERRYLPDSLGGPCMIFPTREEAERYVATMKAIRRMKRNEDWKAVELVQRGRLF